MKKLICLGDSLTDADRLFSPDGLGYGYVSRLNELLNEPEVNYEIVNRGVDGFTVSRLLENAGRDCIDRRPDIVTILIGINDVAMMMTTGRTEAQQKDMLARFGQSYRMLLERIRGFTRSEVILMEPFLFPYPREYATWLPLLNHISEQIADLSEEFQYPYIKLQDRLNQAAEADGYAAVTIDGVHLTSHGHRLLADILYPSLSVRG